MRNIIVSILITILVSQTVWCGELKDLDFWGIPFGSNPQEVRAIRPEFSGPLDDNNTILYKGSPKGYNFKYTLIAFNKLNELHTGMFVAQYSSLKVNDMLQDYLTIIPKLVERYGEGTSEVEIHVNSILLTEDIIDNVRSKYISLKKYWSTDRYWIKIECGPALSDSLGSYNLLILYRDRYYFENKLPEDSEAL